MKINYPLKLINLKSKFEKKNRRKKKPALFLLKQINFSQAKINLSSVLHCNGSIVSTVLGLSVYCTLTLS